MRRETYKGERNDRFEARHGGQLYCICGRVLYLGCSMAMDGLVAEIFESRSERTAHTQAVALYMFAQARGNRGWCRTLVS